MDCLSNQESQSLASKSKPCWSEVIVHINQGSKGTLGCRLLGNYTQAAITWQGHLLLCGYTRADALLGNTQQSPLRSAEAIWLCSWRTERRIQRTLAMSILAQHLWEMSWCLHSHVLTLMGFVPSLIFIEIFFHIDQAIKLMPWLLRSPCHTK